jgi:hypothetical protein
VYRLGPDVLDLTLGATVVFRAAQRAERDGRSDAIVVAAATTAGRRYARLITGAPAALPGCGSTARATRSHTGWQSGSYR